MMLVRLLLLLVQSSNRENSLSYHNKTGVRKCGCPFLFASFLIFAMKLNLEKRMKSIMYKTSGTCSQFVEMEADENNVVTRAVVIGGCHGNLQGICKLIVGMRLEDVKERLSGIRCGSKPTSCPDQIAKAIEELEKQ